MRPVVDPCAMLCGLEFESGSWWFLVETFQATPFNASLPWETIGDRDVWLGARIGTLDRRAIRQVRSEQSFRAHDAGWRWLVEDVLRPTPPKDWFTAAPPCHQNVAWKRIITATMQEALLSAVNTYLNSMLQNAKDTAIGDIPRTEAEMSAYLDVNKTIIRFYKVQMYTFSRLVNLPCRRACNRTP